MLGLLAAWEGALGGVREDGGGQGWPAACYADITLLGEVPTLTNAGTLSGKKNEGWTSALILATNFILVFSAHVFLLLVSLVKALVIFPRWQ